MKKLYLIELFILFALTNCFTQNTIKEEEEVDDGGGSEMGNNVGEEYSSNLDLENLSSSDTISDTAGVKSSEFIVSSTESSSIEVIHSSSSFQNSSCYAFSSSSKSKSSNIQQSSSSKTTPYSSGMLIELNSETGIWNPGQNFNLTWNDEFTGTSVDKNKWNFDYGFGDLPPDIWGWGNKELQEYQDDKDNVEVIEGQLKITARYLGGNPAERRYTSARINTKDKFSQKYGVFAARIKTVTGQGAWGAFWMLGDNGVWPDRGEIDIMESGYKGKTSELLGTAHWKNNSAGPWPDYWSHESGYYTLPSGTLSDDFHVYWTYWTPTFIKWGIDEKDYKTLSITESEKSEFHQKFYMIMNLAVGGPETEFVGFKTPESGIFPKTMHIDWIRVWQ